MALEKTLGGGAESSRLLAVECGLGAPGGSAEYTDMYTKMGEE